VLTTFPSLDYICLSNIQLIRRSSFHCYLRTTIDGHHDRNDNGNTPQYSTTTTIDFNIKASRTYDIALESETKKIILSTDDHSFF